MGTPLGARYVLSTYMDPLGMIVCSCLERRIRDLVWITGNPSLTNASLEILKLKFGVSRNQASRQQSRHTVVFIGSLSP